MGDLINFHAQPPPTRQSSAAFADALRTAILSLALQQASSHCESLHRRSLHSTREGVFLACGFWLVDNLVLLGRLDEARGLLERLLALGNDLGLLCEQYDPVAKRLAQFSAGLFAYRFDQVR